MRNVRLVKSVFRMLIANIYISISLSSLRVMVPGFRSWKYYVHGLLFIKFDHIAVCLLCNLVKISLVLQASLPTSMLELLLQSSSQAPAQSSHLQIWMSPQHHNSQHYHYSVKDTPTLHAEYTTTPLQVGCIPWSIYHWSVLPFVCQSSSSLALVWGQA